MKKATAITTILLCVLMASCQTAAQKKANSMAENFGVAIEKTNECRNPIEANPVYQPLNDRLQHANPTLSQLTDNGLPTEEAVGLIITKHNEIARCRVIEIEGLMNSVPGLIPVFVQHYAANDLVLADLIERKITWGEANKRLKASFLEFQTNAISTVKQLDRELTTSHQTELGQRQAAYNSLRQWNQNQQALRQNQQMIDSLNRPVITNCSRFGNTVNCTSR